MKFECGDLERALAISELMPEAREHLKVCAACRNAAHQNETAGAWPAVSHLNRQCRTGRQTRGLPAARKG